jgi:BirA family transcriptional regulator, biotin operon repressor / biotin---[acetyl-CoA-carboxylase] ligase
MASSTNNYPDWLHYLETCPSTNTWAIEHRRDLGRGDVVFTPHQTAGRGQFDRPWLAPTGVLTASLIVTDFPLDRGMGLSLVVGLAGYQAIVAACPSLEDRIQLKWTNDLTIADRKLAGFLCETRSGTSSNTSTLVIGMGLNLHVDWDAHPHPLVPNPISLHRVCSPPEVLTMLTLWRQHTLDTISDWLATPAIEGISQFLPALDRIDALRDRDITLQLADGQVSGRWLGIDRFGRCCLALEDGSHGSFESGRVATIYGAARF